MQDHNQDFAVVEVLCDLNEKQQVRGISCRGDCSKCGILRGYRSNACRWLKKGCLFKILRGSYSRDFYLVRLELFSSCS